MLATNEKIRGRDFLLVLSGVLLTADAFVLDLKTPLNLAVGVPYALVVLLGLWWPGRSYIYVAAIIGSVLCPFGFYFNFTEEQWEQAVVDRGLALIIIWMVAALCLFQKRTQKKKRELQQLVHHIGQFYSGETASLEEASLFSGILDSFVFFTQSRIGVIVEVFENENKEGKPFFQKRAGVVRNSLSKKSTALIPGEPSDLEYYNLEPLLNEALDSGKPLIMNCVAPVLSKTPLPVGLHLMESFMILPLYRSGRLLGLVAVANREGGYENRWVENLKPLLMAGAGSIRLLRMDEEKRGTENALDDENLNSREMEKDPGRSRRAAEEKNACLDENKKEENRLVEEGVKENENCVVVPADQKDPGEKEEQLTTAGFNRLEKGPEDGSQKAGFWEEDWKRVRDQLREKDRQVKEIESPLLNAQNHLREKERRTARVEDETLRVERASHEKDRRYRRMDPEKNEVESKPRETEARLSRLEGEILLVKETLNIREGFFQKTGVEVQEALAAEGKKRPSSGTQPTPMRSAGVDSQENANRSSGESGDDASAHEEGFVSHDEAAQGICGLDLEGNTTFINPAGAKMLGYASGELIGKNQRRTMHHSRIDGTPYRPQECRICNTLAEGVVSHVVDEVFWRKDGSHFPVEYLSAPISKDGRRVGAVVAFTDASRRGQNENAGDAFRLDSGQESAEREEERKIIYRKRKNEIAGPEKEFNGREEAVRPFRQYTEEVERSNRDLRDFASIASHDLQEPLRKIIGFGSRLRKDCASSLDDQGRDYLDRMERAANQMQNFIDELLQYSKLSVSPPARGRRVDLGNVIADVLIVLESRIEETQAAIEVGVMPAIEADRVQMHQLFLNLISNGLKFHEPGKPPVIGIGHRRLENGLHEIRVEDQGIGFEEKHLDRIFKPFERLHGRMEYEGAGMGLAICRKIVRGYGGEITAKSSPRMGAIFIVALPGREVHEKAAPQ